MGNTKSSFGPAQFICKLGDFFKKARFFSADFDLGIFSRSTKWLFR
jgi:hypothetical protein